MVFHPTSAFGRTRAAPPARAPQPCRGAAMPPTPTSYRRRRSIAGPPRRCRRPAPAAARGQARPTLSSASTASCSSALSAVAPNPFLPKGFDDAFGGRGRGRADRARDTPDPRIDSLMSSRTISRVLRCPAAPGRPAACCTAGGYPVPRGAPETPRRRCRCPDAIRRAVPAAR